MNKYFTWFVVIPLFFSFAAGAVVRPGWERPILKATLESTQDSLYLYPLAREIVMNKRDENRHATSFTMIEDNGIRCIKAPCPNIVKSFFRITSMRKLPAGSVKYHAIENIPSKGAGPRARVLELVDRSKNITTRYFKHLWAVTIFSRVRVQNYVGNPEPVFTPMTR